MTLFPEFNESHFHVQLNKPTLSVGLEVTFPSGEKGKIIRMEAFPKSLLPNEIKQPKEDFCVVELHTPDANGCKFIEMRKTAFDYLTQEII